MEYLVVGLGNPGPRYSLTRHNAGFVFLDYLADGLKVNFSGKKSFEAEYATADFAGAKLHLLKPQTFMNLSGRSVAAFLRNSNLAPEQILVFQDEVEIPFGTLRIKLGGGDAGHNGLKSIRENIGSGEFYRFRIGVGRDGGKDLSSHVLGRYEKAEEETLMHQLKVCEEALEVFIKHGLQKAQMKAAELG